MDISICSFSFHRLLGAGKQDMFQYIKDSKSLGATLLQPWNATLVRPVDAEAAKTTFPDVPSWAAPVTDQKYLADVRAAAVKAGMGFEGLAVDQAHIYEEDPAKRQANRARAYIWMDIAAKLGARMIRIDAGGPPEMPADVFKIIVAGYEDLVARGAAKGVDIVIENHWGPSPIPENVVKILGAVKGLGLLFDTNNWAKGMQEKGWQMCAKYATATHIKTFEFDANGNEPGVDIPKAIKMLQDAGYKGVWGIESCPKDGDEMGGVRKTIDLIRRCVK